MSRNVTKLYDDKPDPQKIYHLRKAGYSFQMIAEMVESTVSICMNLYREFQVDLAKEVSLHDREAMALLELARLDELQTPFYIQALQGDTKSLDGVLKIMAHRMKIGGLDQANPTDPRAAANIILVGGSQQDFIDALAQGKLQNSIESEKDDTVEAEVEDDKD